jgi:hypothetical protein
MKYFVFVVAFLWFLPLCYGQIKNKKIKPQDYCELLNKLLADRYIITMTDGVIDTNLEENVRVQMYGSFVQCTNLKFYKKNFIGYESNDSTNESRAHYQIFIGLRDGMYVPTFAVFPSGYTISEYYKRKNDKWVFIKKEWGVQ